jgi:quercetin dioxygenase-like cupin family protein
MPYIQRDEIVESEPFPGMHSKALVGKDNGSVSLTVANAGLEPGAGVPLHIHPNHEEAILILEGAVEGVLGEEVRTLGPGDVLLAPAGVKHSIINRSNRPARVITIFPTTAPKRTFV